MPKDKAYHQRIHRKHAELHNARTKHREKRGYRPAVRVKKKDETPRELTGFGLHLLGLIRFSRGMRVAKKNHSHRKT